MAVIKIKHEQRILVVENTIIQYSGSIYYNINSSETINSGKEQFVFQYAIVVQLVQQTSIYKLAADKPTQNSREEPHVQQSLACSVNNYWRASDVSIIQWMIEDGCKMFVVSPTVNMAEVKRNRTRVFPID